MDRLIQDEAELDEADESGKNNYRSDVAMFAKNNYRKAHFKGTRPDKSKSTCNYCKKVGHWAAECRKREADNRKKNYHAKSQHHTGDNIAFMTTTNQMQDHEWLADSGASSHMTALKPYFSTYDEYQPKRRIVLGDSSAVLLFVYSNTAERYQSLINNYRQ